MHPKSPRQEKPSPWTDNAVVCISSKYSRLALFAIGTLYILMSLTWPAKHQQLTPSVRDFTDVKRLMKREEDRDITQWISSPDTKDGEENIEAVGEALMTSTSNQASSHFTSYLPSLYPVLKPKTAAKKKPVNVRFLMGSQQHSQSEFLVEGIERSAFLKLITMTRYNDTDFVTLHTNKMDTNLPILWMADLESMGMDCHVLQRLVTHVAQNAREGLPTALVLMDYSGSTERLYCPTIDTIVPRDSIRMTRRNIVQNRYWDMSESWVNAGEIAVNDGNEISGGNIMFAPLFLRDAFVLGLATALEKTKQLQITKNLADLPRERDVAHFWTSHDYSHYSFLRDKVGAIVTSLTGQRSNGREIHTVVKSLGEVEELENNQINYQYIEQMIRTKIVVVAQRDEWEGSLRLMESLASGALVIADKALAMPNGLEDRQSIVLYDSAQSLKDAIMYYLNPRNDKERLSIARQGFEIAMGRHRSWHRLEEVVFGTPLTNADKSYENTPMKRKRRDQKQDGKTVVS